MYMLANKRKALYIPIYNAIRFLAELGGPQRSYRGYYLSPIRARSLYNKLFELPLSSALSLIRRRALHLAA